MSKIKYLSAFLLLFTAFNFISCEDIEPIDSTIVLNPDPGCVSPASFRASDFVNGTNINLNWVAGGEEESWEIQYGISGFTLGNGTSIFSESTNLTIANLISTNSYQFYVRSNCSENEVSSWVGPIVVNSSSNNNCATPVTVSAIRSATNTEITLNWNSAGQETSWEVQYGATGFGLGSGTIVLANARSIQVSGLVLATSYDFYVRAICSPTEKSNWTAVSTVLGTNPGGGTGGTFSVKIDGVDFIANNVIAVKNLQVNPLTNQPVINPETGQQMITYTVTGSLNSKIVNVQFTELNRNSYDIPENGGAISYFPNGQNPLEMYVGISDDDENIGNITVTANDTANRKLSATFNCKLSLIDMTTGDVIGTKQLTNGVITNVNYTIQ